MTLPGKHRLSENRHQTSSPLRRRLMTAVVAVSAAALAVTAAIPIGAATAAADTPSVSLNASRSTWITSRQPTSPHNQYPYLSATASADRAFVAFPTGTLDAKKKIGSATLTVRVQSTAATAAGFQVYPTSSSWKAATLTAANRPASGSTPVNTALTKAVRGTTVSIPLNPSAIVSGAAETSFEIGYAQRYVGTTFTSPTLSIRYADAAAPAPTPTATPTATPTPTTTPTSAPKPTATPTPAPSPTEDPVVTPPTATGIGGSFAIPAPGSSAKKVFAHYFPPYPVSIDNASPASDYYARNYIDPEGEGGKHAAYGGLLRDRPIGRAPLSGDWRTTDLGTEVDQAADAGIDGFTVDVMSWSGQNWDTTVRLMQAAADAKRGFTVVPNVDASSGAVNASPAAIAASLAKLYSYSSAYKLSDGRYVLSSFAAEDKSPAWWSSVIGDLKNTYGISVAFIAVLQNASDANLAAFSPISYGLSQWGARTAATIQATPDLAARAHALGDKWMQPVAVQDSRPNGGKYAEAGNTETLRASWNKAISDGADFVQIATWNDYSENTDVAPSDNQGVTFLDVSAYYLAQFKTGSAPKITSDSAYITHRDQLTTAVPQIGRVQTPNLDGTGTAPRNTVEVLTMLTAPATVKITVGSTVKTVDVPAGVTATTVPLTTGTVSATIVRGGQTVLAGTSPYTVTAKPLVNDMEYFGVTLTKK
ncbi:endo-1,3-alpha-glucanase family glycosylhydrolase [Leifsonia aquatica]|uniref:endo-1,3-alpha-glucanase family glycosylhydrolase n=1 Tax=Leifsonia aquatica TaxID=144185 RepID=UPI00381CA7B1